MQRPKSQQGLLQVLPALLEAIGSQLTCCARRKHSLAAKLCAPFARKGVVPDQARIGCQPVELIEKRLMEKRLTFPLLQVQR